MSIEIEFEQKVKIKHENLDQNILIILSINYIKRKINLHRAAMSK